MSAFRHFLCPLLGAVTWCQAQTPVAAPSTSTHAHTPPASTHGHGVVVLDQFVTSASPFGRDQADLAQATTVLTGQALLLKQQPSLGDTLSAETGINATSFGPGASRPIIRGLGGDRIRLLENSVGTLDASVISPDHAVSIEPLLVERIEIVRGPASLLYGSSAVGGVVNVITHRIETDLPTEPVRGSVELRGGTAAHELAGGGVLDVALKTGADRAVVFHVDGFQRRTENMLIPGFAESARVRAEETTHAMSAGDEAPEFPRGHLPNSALRTESGAVGVSFVTPGFHFGISHAGIDSNYGVPGHAHHEAVEPLPAEGVRIDLRQRRTDFQGEWHEDEGFVRGARFKFGDANYRHVEIEPDGAPGSVFTNRSQEGRFEVLHGSAKSWAGAVGAQIMRSKFGAEGEEAFVPSSRTDSAAVFAFEELTLGPIAWQLGGRYERTKIVPVGRSERRDRGVAASLGAVWKFDPQHSLALSASHTGRAPNAQELYADGPHAGTGSYEIGNVALGAERSLALEATLRRREGNVTGAATLFANRFRGYIFEEPTGLIAVEDGGTWEFLSPESATAEAQEDSLPVYRYVQREARFWGAELETIWHLHESTRWNLDLRLAADFTRGREGGRHLPRIPAARTTGGVAWSLGAWSAGAECQFVSAQRRVAANESASGGYRLASAHVSRRFTMGHAQLEIFLRGSNLLDAEARPHTSFVKELAPLAGRSAAAGVRVVF